MADIVVSECDRDGDGLNSQEHPVLDDAGNDKIALSQQDPKELDVKKKRLLEELESALVPRDALPPNPNPNPNPNPVRSSLGLGIEVIDETALLETIPKSSKNGKQSRKRTAKKTHKKSVPVTVTETEERVRNSSNSSSKTKTTKYPRKVMEALRFVNVSQQRKFWKAIYGSLETTVANEYDTLVAAPNNRHPLPCLPNKKPILAGAVYCENMDSELQLVGSSENVSPVDPSHGHRIMGEDGRSSLEECNEDDDSDDDYASIQRPAFLVEGEPNFDSGPPEDGWEYLRRVRWEAGQIPKVKVAKLDRSKLSKEQSAYMPKIPDIAKCPEHLLPLKQWEDVFLAEFSALRANLSCLEGSSAMYSCNPLSVHSSKLPGNNFGESANVMKRDVLVYNHLSIGKAIDQPTNLTAEDVYSHLSIGKAIDQPTNLAAEDKDSTLPVENPGLKTSIDQTSSSCPTPTPPLVSAILGMDSVARVSMLLKRIRLLEPANTITRNDCMWIFALCATVDAPLDADTSAALRSLLRKCASIRAEKAELDDEVVILNILATISGKYFGQSEN